MSFARARVCLVLALMGCPAEVELGGVTVETMGEGGCLDELPYVPGRVRVPDAGPDPQEAVPPGPARR